MGRLGGRREGDKKKNSILKAKDLLYTREKGQNLIDTEDNWNGKNKWQERKQKRMKLENRKKKNRKEKDRIERIENEQKEK